MRIGIFGGTFDPPHEGHRKFAEEFISRLSLDLLLIIPTCIPPHKIHDDTAPSEDRLNMLNLLFGNNPCIEVSDIEIKRHGKSYTADTVRQLHDMYENCELIFLLGSDMLLSFHNWWKPEEIIKYVKICAVMRSNDIEKAKLIDYVNEHFPQNTDRFIICDFSPVYVSSTEIRQAIRNKKSIRNMTSVQVEEYIKEKELYL